jgi:hypothetical protein
MVETKWWHRQLQLGVCSFSFRVTSPRLTSPVMAGLVPAIGRGTLPLPMAGTSPAMTVKAGCIQGRSAWPAGSDESSKGDRCIGC